MASAFSLPILQLPIQTPLSRIACRIPAAPFRWRIVAAAAEAVSSSSSSRSKVPVAAAEKEEVFFDGGPHYGDLVTNLVLGFSLIWLPLTVAAVFRALFLRYRFSTARVTILSGLTGGERRDFGYGAIKDVRYVPRFIGEWGDVVITLRDDTKHELKCVPRFREIARYCLDRAQQQQQQQKPASAAKKKGFQP